jgi:hypothetical protein
MVYRHPPANRICTAEPGQPLPIIRLSAPTLKTVLPREHASMRRWLLPILDEVWKLGLFVMVALVLMWAVMQVR